MRPCMKCETPTKTGKVGGPRYDSTYNILALWENLRVISSLNIWTLTQRKVLEVPVAPNPALGRSLGRRGGAWSGRGGQILPAFLQRLLRSSVFFYEQGLLLLIRTTKARILGTEWPSVMTDEARLGSGKTCVGLSSRTIFSVRSEFGTACPVGCGSGGKTSNAAGGWPSPRGRAAAGSAGRGLGPVRRCPKQAVGRGGPGHGVAVTPPSPEHVPPDWLLSAPRACRAAASGLSAGRPRPLVALALTSLLRRLHPVGPSPRGHPRACVGAVVSARTSGLVPAAARPPRGRPAPGEACAGEDPAPCRERTDVRVPASCLTPDCRVG